MLLVRTPLRIGLMGGGTDIQNYYAEHGGSVISFCINQFTYVGIKPMFDDNIRLHYKFTETVDNVDGIEHQLIRNCMKFTGVTHKVEIVNVADVPTIGTGLGSSSSFTVGLLNILHRYKGEMPDPEQLAKEACHIEIDLCHAPIGKQDQYAAAYGGINRFDFNKDGTVTTHKITLSKERLDRLNKHFMLFFTGTARSTRDILHDQNANIKSNVERLSKLKSMVALMEKAITSDEDFDVIGKLLHESWMEKRKLATKVSNSSIDKEYEAARSISSRIGGKVTGAGGGGFLFFYCPPEFQDQLREKLSLKEVPIKINTKGSEVILDTSKLVE